MGIKLINNFSTAVSAAIATTDVTITLPQVEVDKLDFTETDATYILTLFEVDNDGLPTGKREIVYADGKAADSLSVTRAQEGTTAKDWPTGTPIEARITAGMLEGLKVDTSAFVSTDANFNVVSANVTVGAGEAKSVVLGDAGSATGGDDMVSIGREAATIGTGGVSLGAYAIADGDNGGLYPTAIGGLASATGEYATALGAAYATGTHSVAAGRSARGYTNSVSFGFDSQAGDTAEEESVSVGSWCKVTKTRSVGLGSDVQNDAPESVTLGYAAASVVTGGIQINAIPFLPASPRDIYSPVATNACRRAAAQTVVETDPLDLTSGTAAVTLDMPTGTMFFIDSIDVVVVGSVTPGGAPQITVGPDNVTPATYLAATPVGKTAVGGRETHTPLVLDGVTSLRAATSTAGTGTTYTAKVVFRGYVMEL